MEGHHPSCQNWGMATKEHSEAEYNGRAWTHKEQETPDMDSGRKMNNLQKKFRVREKVTDVYLIFPMMIKIPLSCQHSFH